VKRVIVFSTTTGYQLRAFDEAAVRLGIDLRLASDRCHVLDDPWRDHAVPVRFQDPEQSLRALESSLDASSVDGVLAVGDRPTVLAARVARRFGVRWHPPDAAEACCNKLLTRERLRDAGLAVPWFARLEPDAEPDALDVRFPCVVKPVALSGSRGVIRADDTQELSAAVSRLRKILDAADLREVRDAHGDAILVEGFIPGREFAVEALLDGGRFHPFAIFDKPDPLDGPFFEETIYVTPSRAPAEQQAEMRAAVQAACQALGLWHGPVHAECRVGAGRVHVLEVAARPIGGLCARAVRFRPRGDGDAIGLEEVLLRHAARLPWEDWTLESEASGVMMIPIPAAGIFRGVEGESRALAVEGVTDLQITTRLDQPIQPLPEGASYLGFIFARGPAPRNVERALRLAHAQLRFQIDRPVPVA
jgi:phosphoribosylaminoimidazole carboxylase (NCAIR synthetase)